MDPITFVDHVATNVFTAFLHNWPFLLLGIVVAAALKVYVGTDRVGSLLRKRTDVAVAGSVTVAVATPFCSCGTTAVVISMLASSVPWAPVVAFMVASPLSSPDSLVYSAGLFGWPFATFFFVASIFLGIAGGIAAHVAEKAGLLENQARFLERQPAPAASAAAPAVSAATPAASAAATAVSAAAPAASASLGPASAPQPDAPKASAPACGCGSVPAAVPSLGPGAASVAEFAPAWRRLRLPAFAAELRATTPKMVLMFAAFAGIGYAALEIVPTSWLTTMLGGSSSLSVVFAATLGIPFYLSEGSLPLVSTLMHGGMGAGPATAFLITGAGTSIGAISGGLVIARWRVLAIVVGTLWVGAVLAGLIAQVVLE